MQMWLRDLRHTVRALRTSPGLVIVSVLSLGLGLGLNFTLFSAIEAVFFYEPSLANPREVVAVEPGNSNQFSYLNYRDLDESGIFVSTAGSRRVPLILRSGTEAELVAGLAVTPGFFEFIGVPPGAGRYFSRIETMPERQPRVMVLGHAFWQRRFNADPAVIGRELLVNGEPFVVTGVLPERYRPVTMLQDMDAYVPITRLVLPTIDDRGNGNALNVLARLRPGMTRTSAASAVTALGRRLEQTYPDDNADMGRTARVLPVRGGEFAGSPAQLIAPAVLLALFGLVLLSACANVAGLLLARSAHRQREIAVRIALGSRRLQVVRLMLTGSFTLALLGAAAGALLATWLMGALNTVIVPKVGSIHLSLTANASLAIAGAALVFVTSLLCGLAPALRVTRADVSAVIQGGEGHGVTGRLRIRHAFVVGQVAACVVLLVLSSLMLRSLLRVTTMDTGIDLDRGVVAQVTLDPARYALDAGLPLGERIVERLRQVPGVEGASFANMLALGGDRSAARLQVEGRGADVGPRTFVNSVAPGYFNALGVTVVRGRDFDTRDRRGSPPVAIVTEAFARQYFPDRDALGQRVRFAADQPYFEIVGVARDHMYGSYGDASSPVFYSAYAQRPQVSTQIRPIVVIVRTTVRPATLVREVRQAIADVDSTVSITVETMRDATGGETELRRFATRLLASAGSVGLLLAFIGLSGMMAFLVTSRTREIGVRMALGASIGRILRDVLTQGLKLVGVGLVLGTIAALMLGRAMAATLAGLSPADPVAFGGTAIVLVVVGLVACYAPARRAARVDPLRALRHL